LLRNLFAEGGVEEGHGAPVFAAEGGLGFCFRLLGDGFGEGADLGDLGEPGGGLDVVADYLGEHVAGYFVGPVTHIARRPATRKQGRRLIMDVITTVVHKLLEGSNMTFQEVFDFES